MIKKVIIFSFLFICFQAEASILILKEVKDNFQLVFYPDIKKT